MAKRKRPYKPFDPAQGPWLIWSYHWNCWHRRSSDGGACGYTNDIAHAGIFDEKTARAYHDPPPYRRDEAIPTTRVMKQLKARLIELERERDEFSAKIEQVRALFEKAA